MIAETVSGSTAAWLVAAALVAGALVAIVVMSLVSINRYREDDFGRTRPSFQVERINGHAVIRFGQGGTAEQHRDLIRDALPVLARVVERDAAAVSFDDIKGKADGTVPFVATPDPAAPAAQLPIRYRRRPLLTAKQVAKKLGMSRRWVYDHHGQIPGATRLGYLHRFDPDMLDAYIVERAREKPEGGQS